MKAVLLDAGRPEAMTPVTCTRALGDCPVANRPLQRHQEDALRAAGLDLAPAAPGELMLTQRGAAWLSPTQLAVLAVRGAPVVLREAGGEPLAWIGEDGREPVDAETLEADAESFLLRYAWDLLGLNERLVGALEEDRIEGDVSPRAEIHGPITLGPRSRILPGVYIEGRVMIGADCKIGPNCYLRGNTSIGDGCHIGQAVEIKNCLVMARTSVGHLSYCGDSILGEGVNFGAGTITANLRHDGRNHRASAGDGARIDTGRRKLGVLVGDGVHTGIHTSFYPGCKMGPHTSTRPGEVVMRDRETATGA